MHFLPAALILRMSLLFSMLLQDKKTQNCFAPKTRALKDGVPNRVFRGSAKRRQEFYVTMFSFDRYLNNSVNANLDNFGSITKIVDIGIWKE